jgi:D-alanine--poly(phosphoribitol) ligase subunit 1
MKFCFEKKDFIELDSQPNKLAVIGDDFELTWNEFKNKVDELVSFFESKGINNLEKPVVVYGHKSANMLVTFYAMMKLHIAYIPVDVVYPKDRVSKIINTAESEVIINTTNKPLDIDNNTEIKLEANSISFSKTKNTYHLSTPKQDPLVYIIFTSGSTGDPKGVQISTEAVQSFTKWMSSADYNFNSKDVFINTALLSFDLSVFEVMTFGKLGATIILNNKKQCSDPNQLMDRIENNKGTVWISTPSFALTYSRIEDVQQMKSIHTFLFCGEVLPHPLAKKLLENFSNSKVINTYGPTEATVATTIVNITPEILDKYNPLPVGKSKMDSQLLIENDEIIIVGPNVSVGYVKNEKLNEEKFTIINGQRVFKTGDNGFIKDNMLFFHGRNDDLVKLHGYRIELNEITLALDDLDYVIQAETIALKRNGEVKKIVSLATLQYDVDKAQIKLDLGKTLPNYMIPSDIKIIDEFPLNQNGKADKKLLTKLYLGK